MYRRLNVNASGETPTAASGEKTQPSIRLIDNRESLTPSPMSPRIP
ncbi:MULTISPECIES: hypothetical protein [Dickeya]|nr:hypothetical protein K0H75_02450 [Dickeya fangzhongdai]